MADPLPPDFDDNPEWTDEDFARALPADQVHPPEIAALLVRSNKGWEEVTLELEITVIEKFRATGEGWEARINDALRAADIHDGIRSHAA